MLKTKMKAWLILAVLLPGWAAAQSVEEYQQMAAANNPELRASFQQYLGSLEEGAQTGAMPDPEIAFAWFINPIETRLGPQQARISLTQMFPWFGTLDSRRAISDMEARARFEVFQEKRNRLFYQTEETLLELYELDRSIELAEENLLILNSLVEISLRRYETNQASQVDVLRAQIEQEDLQTQLALLKDNRVVLIQKFNELLNRADDMEVTVPDTLDWDTPIESQIELEARLARQNPELNRLRYREGSVREKKRLAVKDSKPSFGVGLDYIVTGERENMPSLNNNGRDAIVARARFRIPLFRKKYSAKIQQANRNAQSVQSSIVARENKLKTELKASLRDFYDATRKFELYDQKQIQRVQQALNIMTQVYSSDSSNFEEILRMQRKFLSYQLSRIQALTKMKDSAAYIDYLTGVHNITPDTITPAK